MSAGLLDGRNMWIRAFYDFNPEEASYVGWIMESGQARALRELKDGDGRKWTYGLPVHRAWQALGKISIERVVLDN